MSDLITLILELMRALDLKLLENLPKLNYYQPFSRWRSFFSIVLWALACKHVRRILVLKKHDWCAEKLVP